MSGWWLPVPENHKMVLDKIKGAVAFMINDSTEEMLVLVEHHDKLEWIAPEDCLPASSSREYPIELCEVINIKEDT